MKKTERKILWRFLVAGFLVPCLLFSVILIAHLKVGENFTWMLLIPWPTFPLLMSAEAGGGVSGEVMAFLISAAANVLLYGIVGGVVSAVYRRFSLRAE
jgi:hypothetical protein